jgi:hypothetical protein
MYPSSFAHLKNDYQLPSSQSVALSKRRRGLRRGFRAMGPALALRLRSARPRTAGPGYQPCE